MVVNKEMNKGVHYVLGSKMRKTFIVCLVLMVLVCIILMYRQKETSTSHVVTINTIGKYKFPALARQAQQDHNMSPNSICLQSMGRLGNQLFEYASNFGIARSNNMTVTVQNRFNLIKMFQLTAKIGNCKCSKIVSENKGCTFEKHLVVESRRNNVCIRGYLQSWKYFEKSQNQLRKELTFLDSIKRKAYQILSLLIRKSTKASNSKTLYIGVHVRRGDFVNKPNLAKYGYVSANKAYIDKAKKYFRQKYKSTLFVVASDDISWCRKNLLSNDTVFVQEHNTPVVDLAILSMCNHTIMTTGSFGWWAAWLAGGEVVYYSGFPKPGSKLDSLFNEKDYRLPRWIKM